MVLACTSSVRRFDLQADLNLSNVNYVEADQVVLSMFVKIVMANLPEYIVSKPC